MENKQFFSDELKIKEFWKNHKIYEKITIRYKSENIFRFIDGPPFVSSGNLHYGHVLVSYLKDTFRRYINGHNYLNKLGFDCHGLPIESVVNKLLGVYTKEEVEKLGIDNYNKKCKEIISQFSGEWQPIFERIGRFVDFKNEYKTMDFKFMESVWWVFNELWKKDLIYNGFKIMPYSPELTTPLSNFEAGQNYKDIVDPAIYVKFPLKYDHTVKFIAWTTTPYTLLSNLALCVNPNITYVKIKDHKTGEKYIIAKDCIKNIYNLSKKNKKKKSLPCEELDSYIGSNLKDIEYIPPFNYFSKGRIFKVVLGDFVEANSGSGIVHMSPSFGEEDCKVCLDEKIIEPTDLGYFCPIDDRCCFTNQICDFEGVYVRDASDKIIHKLKKNGTLLKKEMHLHSYPHCWRTDKPLIYRAIPSMFVKVTALKEKLIKNNKKINWIPGHVGSNRFGNWLENIKDWSISRSRYFGTPIPVWVSDDGEEMISVGSVNELVKLAGLKDKPTDLHREFIDDITIPSKKGKGQLKKISGIFDCWFESGSVPYAQIHYPFENKDVFDNVDYISDFICEGIDQTRGWFYTLLVLSTALFDKPPAKNILCSGLILDENGKKMSKRLQNYPPINTVLDIYGSDSLRMYLISSPAANAQLFNFKKDDIADISKRLVQWYNVYKFFREHYTKFKQDTDDKHIINSNNYRKSDNIMDIWIITRVWTMITSIKNEMDQYRIYKVKREIFKFIEDLANWYVKFNRKRLKGIKCSIEDQTYALSTLHYVLLISIKASHPFLPYFTESMYQELKVLLSDTLLEESIAFYKYPHQNEFICNPIIEKKMNRLHIVTGMVRNLRNKTRHTTSKIPIKCITIAHNDSEFLANLKELEIYTKEAVNVVNIKYISQYGLVKYRAIPNDKILGRKYRKLSQSIKEKIRNIDKDTLKKYSDGEFDKLKITVDNEIYILESNEYKIDIEINVDLKEHEKYTIENKVLVVIDLEENEEVLNLYTKTLFVRTIQDLRKEANLHPWNPIKIYYQTNNSNLLNILNEHIDIIIERIGYDVALKPELDSSNVIISKNCKIREYEVNITIITLE